MAIPALRKISLLIFVALIVSVASGYACFGPKLFIGVEPGLEGEMRYHLLSIYLHEKTGIDSTMIELDSGQTALQAIGANEIDLGFSPGSTTDPAYVLTLEEGINLYSGDRPRNDLQFSTTGKALSKLGQRLDNHSISTIRQSISSGILPATAVRKFMMQSGWI